MSLYDNICDHAIANYGLITTAEAEGLGVIRKDIGEWVKLGRLEKLGRGVYRIAHYMPTEYDHYAAAVALVGGDAMLWGDSVLAMHNLAQVNPLHTFVAVNRRVRKELPEWLQVVKLPQDAQEDYFNGIRCQNLASAIRNARGRIMTERLVDAVKNAEKKGLLRLSEARNLKKELNV